MSINYDEEIRRKALAGIKLTNPTKESQAKYDAYKSQANKTTTSNKTTDYAQTTQGRTGQVQYSPVGTITNAPTPSNIQLTDSMVDEIKRKAANGIPLTNWSAQKQEIYNTTKNPAPEYKTYSGGSAPTYNSQYESLINSALNELLGSRGTFSYDYESDPLYQQYKESYRREGDRALTNSMAEATALTGGRTNSNAIIAGQQAQNYYNAQLNDKIPELEQYAYQKYLDDLAQQQANIQALQSAEAQKYAQYQDQLAQFNADRDFEYRAIMDQNNYNYQNYRDTQAYDRSVLESDRNYDYNLWNAQNALALDQRNFDYQKERDSVSDSQWQKQFDQSVSEFAQQMAYNKERAAASDSQWQQQFDYGKTRDSIADSQWQQQFDRSKYEYALNRTDALKQQAIENALNEYKANGSSASNSNNGYSFKDYANQVKAMVTDSNSTLPTYTKDNIREQIAVWYENGSITKDQASQLFDMYGL